MTVSLSGDYRPQERHEVPAGVAPHACPKNLSGARVERREERQRAMAVVLEAVSFEATRAERQHGIKAIECLDMGLLVNAKHRCMLRRIEVQADHVGRLRLKVRVVGQHVATNALRFDPCSRPNSVYEHVAHAEVLPELARSPVRRAVGGLATGSGKDANLHPRRQHLGYFAQMSRVQTSQRVFEKTLLPTRHVGWTATQSLDDRVQRTSF